VSTTGEDHHVRMTSDSSTWTANAVLRKPLVTPVCYICPSQWPSLFYPSGTFYRTEVCGWM